MNSDQPPVMPRYEARNAAEVPTRVTVVDFDMSFGHLVRFFVKAAIAAIPAAIILFVIGIAVAAVFGGLIGGLSHR